MGKKQEIPPSSRIIHRFFVVLRGSGTFTTERGYVLLQEGSSIYHEKDELKGIKSNEEF